MTSEWFSAYTRAIEQQDPERLESLAAEARALMIDHIDDMEADVVHLRDAVRLLDAYLEGVRQTHMS